MRYALLSILLFTVACEAGAQSIGKESLSHLDGVQVVVEEMSKSVERAGLSSNTIKTDVELALRKSSIEVYTEEESNKAESMPYLYVQVSTFRGSDALSNAYAFSIQVSLHQMVTLMSGEIASARTYRTAGATGLTGSDNLRSIRDFVEGRVNVFINDWLEAHGR